MFETALLVIEKEISLQFQFLPFSSVNERTTTTTLPFESCACQAISFFSSLLFFPGAKVDSSGFIDPTTPIYFHDLQKGNDLL